MTAPALTPVALAGIDPGEINRLLAGDHDDPHRILGAHPARIAAKGAAKAVPKLASGGRK